MGIEGEGVEGLVKLFKSVPKASLELLLRNLKIRDSLKGLYEKHSSGLPLSYDEGFEGLFNDLLGMMLRPLGVVAYGVRPLSLLLSHLLDYFFLLFLDRGAAEAREEVAREYAKFTKSWLEHLKITTDLLLGKAMPTVGSTVEELLRTYKKEVEEYVKEAVRYTLSGPLLPLPKAFFANLEEVIRCWEGFAKAFEDYRRALKEAYVKAAEAFIEKANASRFNSYQEFIEAFLDLEAQAFDEVLTSPRFLEAQKLVVEGLMDYVRYCRALFEGVLTSNPANPFATVSLLDEAFRRITDLRGRVRKIEGRLASLEERLEALERARGES